MSTLLGLSLVLALGVAPAVQQSNPRALVESGQYEAAVDAVATLEERGNVDPSLVFLAAGANERLNRTSQARRQFDQLAASPANSAWRFIGESGLALLENQRPNAVAAARRAAEMNPNLFEAHYQLGLALARTGQMGEAAAAFERATELRPSDAYAHYKAGLAYSKVRRVDQMARHFETFLKLAPDAPERGAVQSIMRTVRGR